MPAGTVGDDSSDVSCAITVSTRCARARDIGVATRKPIDAVTMVIAAAMRGSSNRVVRLGTTLRKVEVLAARRWCRPAAMKQLCELIQPAKCAGAPRARGRRLATTSVTRYRERFNGTPTRRHGVRWSQGIGRSTRPANGRGHLAYSPQGRHGALDFLRHALP